MSAGQPLAGPHRGHLFEPLVGRPHGGDQHPWEILWAARFIARWEGFLPDAYLDTLASPDVWTIGFGHTGGVHAGEHWSRAHALRVLGHDCRFAAHAVAEHVHHKLTVRQRIALISFVFNLGPGVLEGQFLAALNEGRIKYAADKMLEYNHAGGVVVPGLTNRREAERWMMLHSRARHRNPHKPHRKDR